MFTQLPSAPNILANQFSGTITAELIDDFDMDVAKAIMIQFLDEEKPRKLMVDY